MDGKAWRWKQIDAIGARRNDVGQSGNVVPADALEKELDAGFVPEALYPESGDAGEADVGAGRLNCFAA